jgi:hypothetical protein
MNYEKFHQSADQFVLFRPIFVNFVFLSLTLSISSHLIQINFSIINKILLQLVYALNDIQNMAYMLQE